MSNMQMMIDGAQKVSAKYDKMQQSIDLLFLSVDELKKNLDEQKVLLDKILEATMARLD